MGIGNAQALLQSKEIHKLANYHKGGFIEYVNTYQASILVVIIALISWVLAGLNVFDPQVSQLKENTAVLFSCKSIVVFFLIESNSFMNAGCY